MRRWIALVTAALLAPALVTTIPSAAQAAPADPVKALERRLRPAHGVQVNETTRIRSGKGSPVVIRTTGNLEFGAPGIVAVDLTYRTGDITRRWIEVGGKWYVSDLSDDEWSDRLPVGKTWVRGDSLGVAGSGTEQMSLNVFEPATLRFLTRGSGRRLPGGGGVQYRGENTWAELRKVSASFRDAFPRRDDSAHRRVRWRLWLDDRGLPSRVVTEDLFDRGWEDLAKAVVDTRYTGWGSRVTVAPPPGDQVIDVQDRLGFDPEAPLDIVTKAWKDR
ncbi:hypothetical protein [Streptosporangium carneum]|uniref:Lipoprotein n=1 Tax=Streptosporangium carneum TaxID=47481 RepID=A0A9W6I4K0_9ACTN|nr:hypothetical protein [Streptosporangium carneum]GLK11957.1 hypothetical protein GCM10017600_53650 [Streptosporangium carneum]